MPRHSVVIPTRDRPALVGGAVRSALRQTVHDVEVVVSDNSTDDRTADALAAFTDPRFRSVRTPSPLLMHDSWQFALERATGDAVAYLCDDDALHPRALEIVDRVRRKTGAEIVTWRSCSFLAFDWLVPDERGRVRFGAPYSDAVFRISGSRLLDLAYELRVTLTDRVPKMLNCSVARSVIDRARAGGVRLFRPSCPDYSAMVALAGVARSIVFVDAPLLVVGATPLSIGASSIHGGEAARKFLEELHAGEPRMVMPEVVGPSSSWIAQTMMQCTQDVPVLAERTVDPVHLYGLIGVEIERARRAGADVEPLATEWEAALAGPLAEHADAVRAFVADGRVIESGSYLDPDPVCTRVLDLGPFTADEIDAGALGATSIDEVAAALPRWLAEHATSLADAWDVLDGRAGARRVVLYGLGANGSALLRSVPPDHAVRRRLAVCDDAADDPGPWPRAASADLDARRDYVVLTPASCAALRDRLVAAGFRPADDLATLAELARPSPAAP
jgi:hypothetical protein